MGISRGFRKSRGRFAAGLDDGERAVLAALFEQTAMLLERAGAPAAPPDAPRGGPDGCDEFEALIRAAGLEPGGLGADGPLDPAGGIDEEALAADPALARLLPDGHHDDPLAAAEFRRFSAEGVRETKLARLREAIEAVRPDGRGLVLDEPAAVAVLVSLTDVRLVLAQRLGLVTEEDAAQLEELIRSGAAGEQAQLILTYDYLTWLQETLAGALSA